MVSVEEAGAKHFKVFSLLLSRMYNMCFLCKANYTATAWQHFLSDSGLDLLERAQIRCLQTSPADSVRLEAGAETIRTLARRAEAVAHERAVRLHQETHTISRLALLNKRCRFKRGTSLRLMAIEVAREAGLMDHPRLALPPPTRDPKAMGQERWEIHLCLQGGSTRTSPAEARLADALATIRSHGKLT